MVKIALIHYSMYGHVATLSEAVKKGVEATGATCDIYQVAETLPAEVLEKMHAPPKGDYPVITADVMEKYDGYMFGLSGRFGMVPAQMKTFLDSHGQLWQQGKLRLKPVGAYFSTATQGGGQESLALSLFPYFAALGMVFVPLGYADPRVFSLDEVHGASPWGCGTFAGTTGSRMPTELELGVAEAHGSHFANFAAKLAPIDV